MSLYSRLLFLLVPLACIPVVVAISLLMLHNDHSQAQGDDLLLEMVHAHENIKRSNNQLKSVMEADYIAGYEQLVNEIAKGIDAIAGNMERVAEFANDLPDMHRFVIEQDEKAKVRLKAAFKGLTNSNNFSTMAVLSASGKDLLQVNGVYLPEGGDPIFDAFVPKNTITDESQTEWYQYFISHSGTTRSIVQDADIGREIAILTVMVPVRLRSNKVAQSNIDVDAIVRVSAPLANILRDFSLGDELKGSPFGIVIGDQYISMEGSKTWQPFSGLEKVGADCSIEAWFLDNKACLLLHVPDNAVQHASTIITVLNEQAEQGMTAVERLLAASQMRTDDAIWQAVSILAVLAIIGILIGMRAATSLTQRLRRLSNQARVIASGDLDQQAAVKGNDEVGELAQQFERMRLQVKNYLADLQKNNQQLKDAMEIKSRFVATMSHEIRTPINGVIGLSHLLAETELNDEQRDYAETINSSGNALLSLVNDILDFSKLEAGRMDLAHENFSPRVVLEETVDIIKVRIGDNPVELNVVIAPEVPRNVTGDADRFAPGFIKSFR